MQCECVKKIQISSRSFLFLMSLLASLQQRDDTKWEDVSELGTTCSTGSQPESKQERLWINSCWKQHLFASLHCKKKNFLIMHHLWQTSVSSVGLLNEAIATQTNEERPVYVQRHKLTAWIKLMYLFIYSGYDMKMPENIYPRLDVLHQIFSYLKSGVYSCSFGVKTEIHTGEMRLWDKAFVVFRLKNSFY